MATAFTEIVGHRLVTALILISCLTGASASTDAWAATIWRDAYATFYGGSDVSGTMGGSCGYGNLYDTGYGIQTTALSSALFNNGLSCGACFQIVCKLGETNWCYAGGQSITVTATNYCPQGSFGGWCDTPKVHFDLAYPMFNTLAQEVGGVIPVQYRRVRCNKQGGVRFTITGNPWFVLTLITNVGGDGTVQTVQVKGVWTAWYTATQNWGANWEVSGQPNLVRQALCYRITAGNGQTQVFYRVTPSDWGFGKTYEANYNFY